MSRTKGGGVPLAELGKGVFERGGDVFMAGIDTEL